MPTRISSLVLVLISDRLLELQNTRPAYHLQEWNADIEVLGQVCKPHNPHIGDEECAQVALIGRQVPYAIDFVVDGLFRKK